MFQPLHDKVLLKPDASAEVSKGGILLPSNAQEKAVTGIVLAVGGGKVTPEGKVLPMSVKVGDHVMYSKYTGTEMKLDGVEHLLIAEEGILGII